MNGKNLEQKIGIKSLISRGLSLGLIFGTMYACGDDNKCETDADCKNGYECIESCHPYNDPCGGGQSTVCNNTCEKVDSTKNELTNSYGLTKNVDMNKYDIVQDSEGLNSRCGDY